MRERLLEDLPIPEKQLWLKKHGFVVGGGLHPPNSFHTVWQTHNGTRFQGVGNSDAEVDSNLFDVVVRTLFVTCEVCESRR